MLKREIEDAITNYRIYVNEIRRKHIMLSTIGGGVAQYGTERVQTSSIGDPVYMAATKRERHIARLGELQQKVQYILDRIDWIRDERQKIVLDCFLDGLSVREISDHMGISRKHVYDIREAIAAQMQEKTPA